jgi:hypothetical protein
MPAETIVALFSAFKLRAHSAPAPAETVLHNGQW